MRMRIGLGIAVMGVAVASLLFGGVLSGRSGSAPAVSTRSAAPRLLAGFAPGDTRGLVARLQDGLRSKPANAKGWALLGLAYQQRARETADPAYYTKSDGALRRALSLDPRNLLGTSGLGSLALSRHRFRDALAWGRRAQSLSPSTARAYGVIGDALVELGRYREAFQTFNTMARLKPSLSSYARVSYARELLGNPRAAVEPMELAADTAATQPEPYAWTHVQLGKLYWSQGETQRAADQYRLALQAFPGYVYAEDALAQVEAARGLIHAAIVRERRAVDRIPLPQFVSSLGDLYRRAGDERAARKQYALIGVIQRLLVANGVRTDLETALFDVDHGIRPKHALTLARLGRAGRPSIDGDDVLAWALERNDRCAQALNYSQRALRLGTQDALKFFHRGMIERCLGHDFAARRWFSHALALNPHFSLLWAALAKRLA